MTVSTNLDQGPESGSHSRVLIDRWDQSLLISVFDKLTWGGVSSYADLPPRREGLRWCEAHRRTARRLMGSDEPTSDDPKNCKRASPLQANLAGLSEASGALAALAHPAGGAQAARIMAVIAAPRVLRDATLGPFQARVCVSGPAGLGPGLDTMQCLVVGSSEIASEAVSLYGGRLSHWAG